MIFSGENLLMPLSKEDTLMYLKKYKDGDNHARDVIILHHTRFTFSIAKRFINTGYCVEDLFSIGLVGLLKAVDTFDIEKEIQFLTYAYRCIENEIMMFLRKNKKHQNNLSYENSLCYDDKNSSFETILYDKSNNIEMNYINHECISQVMTMVSSLPEKDQKILTMYFGLNNERAYTQEEIAKEMKVSQSYLSRKLKQILELLRTMCLMKGIIEYSSILFPEEKPKQCKIKKA